MAVSDIRWDGLGSFRIWYDALAPEQQDRLRDKARWEQMTLSAVAKEWGIPEPFTERPLPVSDLADHIGKTLFGEGGSFAKDQGHA